jgi:hypothetical protein
MNKDRALMLLGEVVTFYLEAHEDSADIEPTNDEILDAEKFIELNLRDGEYVHKLDLKDLTDIKADGEILDSWVVDASQTESNSGEEHLVVFDGEYYVIETNWDDVVVGGQKINFGELEKEGQSFIVDKIQEYENRKLSEGMEDEE